MLERLSHPVSQAGPLVVVGPTVPAQQKSSFLAITFEQNIIGEIHESKTFEMSFNILIARVCTGLQNFLGAAIFPRKFCSGGGVNS